MKRWPDIRRFGSLRLGDSASDGAAADALDVAAGKLYTWHRQSSTTLAQIDTNATLQQDLGAPEPSPSAPNGLTELGGQLVWTHGRNIYRTDLFGTQVTTPWITTPSSDPSPTQVSVDSLDRLYVFCPKGVGTELILFRYLSDGSLDQRFSLQPDPARGVSPSSHDEVPKTSSSANGGSVSGGFGGIGMDVSPDGAAAYVTMERVVADSGLNTQAIYKYDLASGATPTSSVFATIDYWHTSSPPNQMVGMDPSYLGSFAGLVVNPVDGRIAVQVTTHSVRTVSVPNAGGGTPINRTVDDFFYRLYTYDSTGALLDDKPIAQSYSPHPGGIATSGISSAPIQYAFAVYSGPYRNMAWARDGSEVYFWLLFDNGNALQFVNFNPGPPYEPIYLCNSAGIIRPEISSGGSFAAYGYALLSTVAGAGCTTGAGRGDIYAQIGVGTAIPSDRIYRYDQDGNLKEIIPITYTHAAGHEAEGIFAQTVKLVDGDLWLLCNTFPTTGFGVGHPHHALLKISGTAGHAMTVVHDWDGEADNPMDVTFDSAGNVYVRTRAPAVAYSPVGDGNWLVKYNSAGVQQWRRELDPGYRLATGGFSWLADDDTTLLYDVFKDANFFEVIKRYDVATDTMLSDMATITTTHDTTFPFLSTVWTGGTGLLLPSGKLAVALGDGSSSDPASSTVAWRSTDRTLYESGYHPSSNYEDEGMAIDADPDGVSMWVMSNNVEKLYRFNISSGALTKTLVLRDESDNAYPTVPFAICGGGAGHGGPPPPIISAAAARRRWQWFLS